MRLGKRRQAAGRLHGSVSEGGTLERIDLSETIQALRAELAKAAAMAVGQEIHFPVGQVELEFHVGVTKDIEGNAGVKFWVVELGAKGTYATESVQLVKVTLEAAVDANGDRVLVGRGLDDEP